MECATMKAERLGGEAGLRGKVVRVVLALALALAFVPAVSAGKAFAAEPRFIGSVYYAVSYDENGYPLYNEDGTFKRDEQPFVNITAIENASGTVAFPAKLTVVTYDQNGQEKVYENVEPKSLNLGDYQGGGFNGITAVDFTACTSLKDVSCNTIPGLQAVDVHGMSGLGLSFYSCPALQTVNTEGCTQLTSFTLSSCDALALPDFNDSRWSQLKRINIYQRDDFTQFDATRFPELTDLIINYTSLSTIDVSRCAKLEYLSLGNNRFTELDAASIPASVKYFNCARNYITDTAALVDRFGDGDGKNVLPQKDISEAGKLIVIEPRLAQGVFMAGNSGTFDLTNAYCPEGEELSNFWQENQDEKNAITNYQAESSDPTVATVSFVAAPIPGASSNLLRIDALKAGTTTLTIKYAYTGTHGTYAGQQVIDFTVAASPNSITAISCAPTAETHIITNCKICGQSHSGMGASIPLDLTLSDPSRPMTNGTYIEAISSNENVVTAYFNSNPTSIDTEYALDLVPNGLGTATITLKGMTSINGQPPVYTDPVTVQVTVSESPTPTLKAMGDYEKMWGEYTGEHINLVSSDDGPSSLSSFAQYEQDSAYETYNRYHHQVLDLGSSYSPADGKRVPIVEATSDNDAVAPIVVSDSSSYAEIRGIGTANVTVRDIWGNEVLSEVTVKDPKPEVAKLSLSQNELTIKVGESFDLATLVQGWDSLDPLITQNPGERFVFKTSDGNIAPIKFNNDTDRYVSQIYGRNVGDVMVSANMRTGTDMGGSLEYIDEWGVEQFDTLTVHVVSADTPTNPVTAIEVTGDSPTVELGSTLQLSATVTPSDADNADELAWSSSDKAVATVDANGKVTPVAPGKAVISAAVGSVSGTFEVTVVERIVPATGITVSQAKTAMKAGETQQLSATVEPSDATDPVVWSSSDEAVLAVDQGGLVTAVGNGSAAIMATAGRVSDTTANITVTTAATGVELDATTLELYVGADASKLTASVLPATASNKEVAWSSSDEGVATVDAQGNVAPVAAGAATITATTADGGFTATCEVTVKQHVTGLVLDKHEATITGADTVQLKATVEPDNATNKNVEWTSSDPSVATVDADGVVTSVAKGTATIKATSEDGAFTDSCAITVLNPCTSITLTPATLALIKGESATVEPVLAGALPGAVDPVGGIDWSSSDTAVASATPADSACAVAALKTGTATITAKISEELVATCSVAVTNPVRSVTISETAKTLTVGDAPFKLTATVDPADADDPDVTWSSSAPSIATVAPDGTVTVLKSGAATIVASAGGKSATCALTVEDKKVADTAAGSVLSGGVYVSDSEAASDEALMQELGGVDLVVDAIEALTDALKQASDALAAAGNTVAGVFDIHFVEKDSGTIYEWDNAHHELTVKLLMTDAMKALQNPCVYYLDEAGNPVPMPTSVEGDYMVFRTTHFSAYAIAGTLPAEGEAGGDTTQTQLSATSGNTLASTGDSPLPLAAACGAGAVALLACGIATQRLRRTKRR